MCARLDVGIAFCDIRLTSLSLQFVMWDLGGQSRLRKLWQHYYENANAVVYVVDSNDEERLEEASEELHAVMSDPRLDKTSLLIFANKQDLPNARSVAEVADKLKLN